MHDELTKRMDFFIKKDFPPNNLAAFIGETIFYSYLCSRGELISSENIPKLMAVIWSVPFNEMLEF